MTESQNQVGSISWMDLTVEDATQVKDFYAQVVGWKAETLRVGDYDDFCMQQPGDEKTVAGICHARGVNAELPAQWLIYITVEDLDASVSRCESLGGKILHQRDNGDQGKIAVIQDPAGAVAALFQMK